MISTPVLALLAFLPTAPPPDLDPMLIHEIPISSVAAANFGDFFGDGSDDVFVLFNNGGTLLVSGGFYAIDGGNFCIFQTNDSSEPVVLSTSWLDIQNNMHTVTTDCDKFPSLDDCVRAHRDALKIMATIFPKNAMDMIPLPNGAQVKVGREGEDGR